jgi:hypothetical protein
MRVTICVYSYFKLEVMYLKPSDPTILQLKKDKLRITGSLGLRIYISLGVVCCCMCNLLLLVRVCGSLFDLFWFGCKHYLVVTVRGKFIVSYCCYNFYLCIFLSVVSLFVPLWCTFCVRGAIMVGVCQFFSLLLVGGFTAWAKKKFSTVRFVYL